MEYISIRHFLDFRVRMIQRLSHMHASCYEITYVQRTGYIRNHTMPLLSWHIAWKVTHVSRLLLVDSLLSTWLLPLSPTHAWPRQPSLRGFFWFLQRFLISVSPSASCRSVSPSASCRRVKQHTCWLFHHTHSNQVVHDIFLAHFSRNFFLKKLEKKKGEKKEKHTHRKEKISSEGVRRG